MYLEDGWELEYNKDKSMYSDEERNLKISNSKKNKHYYTDGKFVKMLSQEEYEESYKELGWKSGTKNRYGNIILTNIEITNGHLTKKVNSNKVDYYLQRGWSLLPIDNDDATSKYDAYLAKKHKEMSDRSRNTMNNYYKNQTTEQKTSRSDKLRKKRNLQTNLNLDSNKDKVWVTNDINSYLVERDEIKYYLENEYRLGRKSTGTPWNKGMKMSEEFKDKLKNSNKFTGSNTKWVNDGKVNKRIPDSLLNEYIENGWKTGRLKHE